MRPEYIDNIFMYHAPKEHEVLIYKQLRDQAKALAVMVNQYCPESEEKQKAIEKIREVVMWANAAIACNGVTIEKEL